MTLLDVTYEVVEQVLLLLPLIGKKLQAKYCGPNTDVERLDEVDYLICTPGRRKAKRIVHVNLPLTFLTRPRSCQFTAYIFDKTFCLPSVARFSCGFVCFSAGQM